MKKRTKIWLIVIALFILLSVIIVAGYTNGNKNYVVPEGAKAGDIYLESDVYKVGSNEYAMQKGILIVLESKISSKLIALPIVRYISSSDEPSDPIFWLSGGPGSSNMGFKPSTFLDKHDVVLVGYRGVDGSVILDCPSVRKASKGVGNNLLSKESLTQMSEAFAYDAEQLKAKGIDINAYTMIDVISDMEQARKALGYDRINLYSQSYGTRIAQIYAYKHPHTIYRSVMGAVNPPGRFVWEAETNDRLLEHYSNLYSLSEDKTINLAGVIKNVSDNMPKRWFFVPIDQGKVEVVANVFLYNKSTAKYVLDAYIAAHEGDASGVALMSITYNLTVPSMLNWGDVASKAVSADIDPNRNYLQFESDNDSIIGAPLTTFIWYGAASWPIDAIPEEYRKVNETDVETLLISGNIDFSTPAEYATDELLPYLNNGQQVILKEMGHTGDIFGEQRDARLNLITSFYETGVGDDSLYVYSPVDFEVKIGLPFIAKTIVIVILGLIILIIAVIRKLIRKKRRK